MGILLADTGHDEVLSALTAQVLARIGGEVTTWQPGSTPAVTPRLILATLERGARRIDPALATLAEEHFPTVPLVVLCAEALSAPKVQLADGRLTLFGHPLATELLLEHVAACRPAVVQRDHPRARVRAGGHGRLHERFGLHGLWTANPSCAAWIEREVVARFPACVDGERAERVLGSLRAPSGDPWAVAWLPEDDSRLLVVGSAPFISLTSRERLPEVWRPAGEALVVRLLDPLAGDVLHLGADDGDGVTVEILR